MVPDAKEGMFQPMFKNPAVEGALTKVVIALWSVAAPVGTYAVASLLLPTWMAYVLAGAVAAFACRVLQKTFFAKAWRKLPSP